VGVSAVNALSEWCEVTVRREGKIYFQRYERGIPQAPVKQIGTYKGDETVPPPLSKFDREIFKGDINYRFDTLVTRFRRWLSSLAVSLLCSRMSAKTVK
jgi:DNA gyrase subunit B